MEVKEAFINRELAAKKIAQTLLKKHEEIKNPDILTNIGIPIEDYELLLEGLKEGWIGDPIRKTEAGLFIGDDTINVLTQSS